MRPELRPDDVRGVAEREALDDVADIGALGDCQPGLGEAQHLQRGAEPRAELDAQKPRVASATRTDTPPLQSSEPVC